MKRRPWFKFHTQDWRADPNLRMCSPAARGLWADMLSLMHEAEPYGHLLVGGVAPSNAQLARLLSIDEALIGALIGDLSDNLVFSRTNAGVIFSRRMVRDAEVSNEGRENISKRWGNSTKSRGITSSPNRPPSRVPIAENHADPITKSQISESDNTSSLRSDVPPQRKSKIDRSLTLSDGGRLYATEHGVLNGEAEAVWDAFKDYHVARATAFADWDAAWRTWVRNHSKFAARGGGAAPRPSMAAVIKRMEAEGKLG